MNAEEIAGRSAKPRIAALILLEEANIPVVASSECTQC